jgi:hypothetical protein
MDWKGQPAVTGTAGNPVGHGGVGVFHWTPNPAFVITKAWQKLG